MKDGLRKYIDDKISELQNKRLTEKEMGELSAYDAIYTRIDKKETSEIEADIKIAIEKLKNRPEDYSKGRYLGFIKMKNYTDMFVEVEE